MEELDIDNDENGDEGEWTYGVLDARVETLTAGGTVDVSGISDQEHAPVAVPVGQSNIGPQKKSKSGVGGDGINHSYTPKF